VGITLPFGRSVVEEQKFIRRLEEQIKSKQSAMVQNLIHEGDSALARFEYDHALKAYHKALNMQPEYKDLPDKIRRTEAAQQTRMVDQQLKAGDRAYAAKDYLTAMVEWSKVLNLEPNQAEAKGKLELVNEKLAQEKIATENHRNLKLIQQHLADGLKQLERREYSKAIAVWERILQLDPGNARVQQYMQVTRTKLRDAVQQLLNEADDDWERGRYVEAVSKWRQCLDLDEGQPVATQKLKRYQPEIQKLVNENYLQGVQAYVQNDLKTATAAWRRVLVLDPTHPKASKHLKNVNTKIEELDALH
jgi:tetratricopeptide (TPR) repeat protein